MKKIILNKKNYEINVEKKREKIEKLEKKKSYQDLSNSIINIINNHNIQIDFINKIYLEQDFREKKLIITEINSKISSYRQQDIRKDLHEKENLITLDDIIEKLVISKLKCYYCKTPLLIIFDKIRDERQWTLDRLNNYDEHTNKNTIVCCLKCNLERRRKNSDKFLFSKQLQTNQIKIKKIANY